MNAEDNLKSNETSSSQPAVVNETAPPSRGSKYKQFLFLRKDLQGFSEGGLIAQGAHASVAAIHKFSSHPDTIKYLEDISNMTTIAYGITKSQVENIVKDLDNMGIEHFLWIEDGKELTCIGTRPVNTDDFPEFQEFRKKFRLFKR